MRRTQEARPHRPGASLASFLDSLPGILAADDVILSVQVSPDLVNWSELAGEFVFEREEPLGDGTSEAFWRASEPVPNSIFLRLEAQERP